VLNIFYGLASKHKS